MHVPSKYCPILRTNVVGSKLYIRTEFCSGDSLLAAVTRASRRDATTTTTLFRRMVIAMLLGLSFLHAHNIVHGDLKPANILLDIFGFAKLVDFGATRTLIWKTSEEHTGTRGLRGTPEYMAPETLLTGDVTPKSDIWSLGCTLYHMATDRTPWIGVSRPWGVIQSLAAGQSFDMSALNQSEIDGSYKEIIQSCLNFDPEARPSALELLLRIA